MATTKSIPSRPVDRRKFAGAAAIAGASAIASPAVAQSPPRIRWRLAASFGRNIPMQYEPAQLFIETVKEITDGAFELQWFGPGDIVGAFQVLDALRQGTVEIGQTLSNYYIGIDPTFAFGTGIPFGMTARGHAAWLAGDGGALLGELYKKNNVIALPAGNSGAHMAGWFRKEIASAADLKGLKLRVAGMAGLVFAKAGGVPQQIAPSDVYPALERGAIDACKLATPADDERVGLHKVAPFYYYPAWNDPGAMTQIMVNLDQWNSLPAHFRGALKAAAAAMGAHMQARYDSECPKALRRLVGQGAQLRALPAPVIAALEQAARQVYDEIGAQNATFKKVYDNYAAFASDHYLWWQAGDFSADALGIRHYRRS